MRYDNNVRLNDIRDGRKIDGGDDENFIFLRCWSILVSFEFHEYVMTLRFVASDKSLEMCDFRSSSNKSFCAARLCISVLEGEARVCADLNMIKVKQCAIQSITKQKWEWFSWKDLMKRQLCCEGKAFPSLRTTTGRKRLRACLQLWLRFRSLSVVGNDLNSSDDRHKDLLSGG